MLESKVLLIEDDPAIVENLSAYLKEERFEVTAVDGQSKALEQIEADRPDIILLDASRPNLIPCHDLAENLVYSARGSDVCMNMARGRVIYQNGAFLTLDLEKIKAEVKQYALPLIFH